MSVKILSIDVGYRNFAYSIVEIDKNWTSTDFINIIEWNNVDLFLLDSENQELNLLGYDLISNLSTLTKVELLMLCNRECIESDNKLPLEKLKKNALELLLKKKIAQVKKKHSKCSSHNKEQRYAMRINICLTKLKKFFDLRLDLLKTIDYFVIENQPKKKNAFLGTIQAMIHSYMYFSVIENSYEHLTKILVDQKISKKSQSLEQQFTTVFRVQLVHAKHKTKLLDESQLTKEEINYCNKPLVDYNQKNSKQKKQADYNFRKKTSEIHCRKILQKFCQKSNDWLVFFDKHKSKCDDLSDCFLQGLHFFNTIGFVLSLS